MSMIETTRTRRHMTIAEATAPAPSFAAIAVELRLAERTASFKEKSFACHLEALVAGKMRSELLLAAASVGLDADVTRNILSEWMTRAQVLDQAAELLRALIPHEDLIRKLIAATKREGA